MKPEGTKGRATRVKEMSDSKSWKDSITQSLGREWGKIDQEALGDHYEV